MAAVWLPALITAMGMLRPLAWCWVIVVGLAGAARGLFDIGVGVSDRIGDRPADHALLLAQFGVVTPENCMKPAKVQAAEGRWDFEQADAFVEFANKNRLKVVGHNLVWAKDDRTPIVAFPDEPLRSVVYRMAEHGITRLPVVDRTNRTRLMGIVSIRDLLQARVRTLKDERHRERTLRVRHLLRGDRSAVG